MTMFRTRAVRADGRAIDVVLRRAHLSHCFTGCCCGRTERGYAAVPVEDDRRVTGTARWIGCAGPSDPKKLAAAMRATCIRLAELDQAQAVRLIREIA